MAHYDITHTCGHDERIELFGKTSERERRIEWLQERPCTECWKKERAAEAEARKNKEAAMIVEKLGNDAADAVNALSNATCTLEGSAKQVAWAEDIRSKCIAQAIDQLRDLVACIPARPPPNSPPVSPPAARLSPPRSPTSRRRHGGSRTVTTSPRLLRAKSSRRTHDPSEM